ncbi:MAG TPA: hypothetical protein VEJ36_05040 [Nitrososphaerales archaeon]|nr:hypothetical protein [Nitrososphaerales archaeon]
MFDFYSALRIGGFAVLFSGFEYFVVNRREANGSSAPSVLGAKPIFMEFYPYHLLFVLPVFIVVSYSASISAWAANVFLLALVEDALYFAWRGRWIVRGDWTAQTFGSFSVGGRVIPNWYPFALLAAAGLYAAPF